MRLTDPLARNASLAGYDSHGDAGGHAYTPDELHNEDVEHEHSDINIKAIVWSAVVVAVVCIGTAVLMYLVFGQLEKQAQARDPKLSPLAMPATVMPPTTTAAPDFGSAPEPRLLTNEPRYLRQLRDREQNELQGYAWVDEKAGVTRIPVDEAKKLLLERGLPVRPDAPEDPRLGTHAAAYGESSSGRTITRPAAHKGGH